MTEPMERSLTDQSDKNQDVGCTPKSVPLMNTADEVALSDKEAVKRLPYVFSFFVFLPLRFLIGCGKKSKRGHTKAKFV